MCRTSISSRPRQCKRSHPNHTRTARSKSLRNRRNSLHTMCFKRRLGRQNRSLFYRHERRSHDNRGCSVHHRKARFGSQQPPRRAFRCAYRGSSESYPHPRPRNGQTTRQTSQRTQRADVHYHRTRQTRCVAQRSYP